MKGVGCVWVCVAQGHLRPRLSSLGCVAWYEGGVMVDLCSRTFPLFMSYDKIRYDKLYCHHEATWDRLGFPMRRNHEFAALLFHWFESDDMYAEPHAVERGTF